MALPGRFWQYVNKDGPIPAHRSDLGPCWIWIGDRNAAGYGRWYTGGGRKFNKKKLSHVAAYEDMNGPVPEGLELDHLCRVRACCKPWHLEAVTRRVNLLRGVGRTAINASATHCPKGHHYSEENTILHKRPGGKSSRDCRTCVQERDRKRKSRKDSVRV